MLFSGSLVPTARRAPAPSIPSEPEARPEPAIAAPTPAASAEAPATEPPVAARPVDLTVRPLPPAEPEVIAPPVAAPTEALQTFSAVEPPVEVAPVRSEPRAATVRRTAAPNRLPLYLAAGAGVVAIVGLALWFTSRDASTLDPSEDAPAAPVKLEVEPAPPTAPPILDATGAAAPATSATTTGTAPAPAPTPSRATPAPASSARPAPATTPQPSRPATATQQPSAPPAVTVTPPPAAEPPAKEPPTVVVTPPPPPPTAAERPSADPDGPVTTRPQPLN